jgi:hypothetical protein
VDILTREMASLRAVAVDPRADAIQRIATLVGLDGNHVRAIVQALDPLVLPLFLEFGSILFFAAAFPQSRIAEPHCTLQSKLMRNHFRSAPASSQREEARHAKT